MVKEAVAKVLMKVLLDNREEYLEAAKVALLDFLGQIKIDGHDTVVEELKANVIDIVTKIKATYDLLKQVIAKYGHPEVK